MPSRIDVDGQHGRHGKDAVMGLEHGRYDIRTDRLRRHILHLCLATAGSRIGHRTLVCALAHRCGIQTDREWADDQKRDEYVKESLHWCIEIDVIAHSVSTGYDFWAVLVACDRSFISDFHRFLPNAP